MHPCWSWLPPINIKGGEGMKHTPHPTQLTSLPLELGGPHPRCSGSLGGVEDYESEEESGKVPGLSTLFSACTSTEAYSVVSVRDFLI